MITEYDKFSEVRFLIFEGLEDTGKTTTIQNLISENTENSIYINFFEKNNEFLQFARKSSKELIRTTMNGDVWESKYKTTNIILYNRLLDMMEDFFQTWLNVNLNYPKEQKTLYVYVERFLFSFIAYESYKINKFNNSEKANLIKDFEISQRYLEEASFKVMFFKMYYHQMRKYPKHFKDYYILKDRYNEDDFFKAFNFKFFLDVYKN